MASENGLRSVSEKECYKIQRCTKPSYCTSKNKLYIYKVAFILHLTDWPNNTCLNKYKPALCSKDSLTELDWAYSQNLFALTFKTLLKFQLLLVLLLFVILLFWNLSLFYSVKKTFPHIVRNIVIANIILISPTKGNITTTIGWGQTQHGNECFSVSRSLSLIFSPQYFTIFPSFIFIQLSLSLLPFSYCHQ